jgi:hypothetical protein
MCQGSCGAVQMIASLGRPPLLTAVKLTHRGANVIVDVILASSLPCASADRMSDFPSHPRTPGSQYCQAQGKILPRDANLLSMLGSWNRNIDIIRVAIINLHEPFPGICVDSGARRISGHYSCQLSCRKNTKILSSTRTRKTFRQTKNPIRKGDGELGRPFWGRTYYLS